MKDHYREAMSENDYVTMNRLRRTTISWSELKSIIMSSSVDDLAKLARSEEQSRTYQRWREDNKNEWESIYDYLLCTKFGFQWVWVDVQVESDGTNKRLKRSVKSSPPEHPQQSHEMEVACNSQLRLCLNDFPYYFAPGIQHWVLWKLGGPVTHDEIKCAKITIWNEFQSEGFNEAEKIIGRSDMLDQAVSDPELFLHWENPPQLQSLPVIDHVHIVIRGRVSAQP